MSSSKKSKKKDDRETENLSIVRETLKPGLDEFKRRGEDKSKQFFS
jgi:hypothetical protein